MIKVEVFLDNDLLLKLQAHLMYLSGKNGRKIAPGTKNAFDMSKKIIQEQWRNWAEGGELIGIQRIKRPNANLSRSIRIDDVSDFDTLIHTNSIYMQRIQEGTKELDMKTTHPYGKKSRLSKKDKIPYLIIPFRWGRNDGKNTGCAHIRNTIPLVAAKIIQSKQFRRTTTTGSKHIEVNALGEGIERAEYISEDGNSRWGDRLEGSGNEDGMVKMLDEARHGKSKTGSVYLTFRIISAESPADKWIRKAVPPIDVVGAVERTTRPIVEQIMQAGLEQDIGI